MDRAGAEALRDSVEEVLAEQCNRAMRGFVTRLSDAAQEAIHSALPNVLLASSTDEMPGLGTVAAWWAEAVDVQILEAIEAELFRVFRRWSGFVIDSPAMTAMAQYLAQVRNRLVLGSHFGVTVYEESFNKIRLALAQSSLEGWTRNQLAQRIAAELSWEKDGPYWRGQLTRYDSQIDEILDAIGAPGNPLREAARLGDPKVQALRDFRNEAVKHLDAERSVWRTRATLIARTEATGAANFGAFTALTEEGVATKKWMATDDVRTRPTHSAADAQKVNMAQPFIVGLSLLQYPGDPAGPASEVANCRCTIVGGDQ